MELVCAINTTANIIDQLLTPYSLHIILISNNLRLILKTKFVEGTNCVQPLNQSKGTEVYNYIVMTTESFLLKSLKFITSKKSVYSYVDHVILF